MTVRFKKVIIACALWVWAGAQGCLWAATPSHLSIAAGPLTLSLDTNAHRWIVTDQRTGRHWQTALTPEMRLLEARAAGARSLSVRLREIHSGGEYVCAASVDSNGIVTFTLRGNTNRACGELSYPGELQTDWEQGALVFCNRSCGQLVPQKEKYPDLKFAVYGNTGLDMPWIGVVDEKRGDGLMLLYETPWDAMVKLRPDAQGRYWPRPTWLPTLGKLGYERKISYRFSAQGGYTALAKMYRQVARRDGLLKTLAEKSRERPHVERLKGAVRLWGCRGNPGFAKEFKAHGISRALLDADGDAKAIQRINDLGYLTHEYDSYCDILEGHGKVRFQRNDVTNNSYVNRDGTLRKGWRTLEGLQYYYLSSARALQAAQTYVPPRLATHPYTARFLDVTSCMDLMEDYNPRHTFDRRQDMQNRQQLNAYFTSDLKLVLGAEHCKAWNVPNADYSEGQNSGPFWWEMPAGHLVPPTNHTSLSTNFLKYAENWAYRIPLWELVFHDCLASTWYWGDSSGYYHAIAPEISDRKDLWNILCGTAPLMWAGNPKPGQNLDYGWNRHRGRMLETYRNTCKFNEIVAFEELISHEFLSPDRAVQRSRFSGGAVAVVNFSEDPRPYETGEGKVMLAPRGFWVKAPGLRQSRLVEGGETVTRLETKDYYSYASPQYRQIGPVAVQGQVTLFRDSDKVWHIVAETQGPCVVDVRELAGSESKTKWELSVVGQATEGKRAVPGALVANSLTIPAGAGLRLFRLQPSGQQETVAARLSSGN